MLDTSGPWIVVRFNAQTYGITPSRDVRTPILTASKGTCQKICAAMNDYVEAYLVDNRARPSTNATRAGSISG